MGRTMRHAPRRLVVINLQLMTATNTDEKGRSMPQISAQATCGDLSATAAARLLLLPAGPPVSATLANKIRSEVNGNDN